MPATKNPTVQLWVNHLTSFIAIGLRSGDNDFTSPVRNKQSIDIIQQTAQFLCRKRKPTKQKIKVHGNRLYKTSINAPI